VGAKFFQHTQIYCSSNSARFAPICNTPRRRKSGDHAKNDNKTRGPVTRNRRDAAGHGPATSGSCLKKSSLVHSPYPRRKQVDEIERSHFRCSVLPYDFVRPGKDIAPGKSVPFQVNSVWTGTTGIPENRRTARRHTGL